MAVIVPVYYNHSPWIIRFYHFSIYIVNLVLFLCMEISTWRNTYVYTIVFKHLCATRDYALDEQKLVHENAVLNICCEPLVLQPAFAAHTPVRFSMKKKSRSWNKTKQDKIRFNIIWYNHNQYQQINVLFLRITQTNVMNIK